VGSSLSRWGCLVVCFCVGGGGGGGGGYVKTARENVHIHVCLCTRVYIRDRNSFWNDSHDKHFFEVIEQ